MLKSKALRSSTIIPPHLYVHRDADRQLQQVLDDMGRPAYVLVARQMGKTNLLLNARKELEKPEDVFAYIDLSNRFSSARECFRNTIDTVLQSHEKRLQSVQATLAQIRIRSLPPHKEHEVELREVLRAIPGKLVIILDEVDSLTTSDFADQIFAQIRSAYFSRANIQEFLRLTYVLSGVAEPSELIKNPKLSPFNIGEKIYLDDFTVEEVHSFLAKADLNITPEVVLRIYQWTNGNPRMTWDVCSEVEDLLAENGAVTSSLIDQIVSRLYLNAFDRAPIDHIRTLVEASPELRTALLEIHRGASVSDNLRSKLYLAGIIASRGDVPRVKNRVIEEALSEQWIREVERRKLDSLTIAQTDLARRHYHEAITAYLEFLIEEKASDRERLSAWDGLSQAYFELGDYRESLKWLQKGYWDKALVASVYYAQIRREANCYFHLGEYEQSVAKFQEVVDWGEDALVNRNVYMNLASAYLVWRPDQHKDEIFRIYGKALEGIDDEGSLTAMQKREFKTSGLYNLSKAHRHFGNRETAAMEMRRALEQASGTTKARLLYEMSDLEETPDLKRQLLRECVDVIVTEMVKPTPVSELTLEFSEATLGGLLACTFLTEQDGCFEPLFDYLTKVNGGRQPMLLNMPHKSIFAGMLKVDVDAALNIGRRVVDSSLALGDAHVAFMWARAVVDQSLDNLTEPAINQYVELLRRQVEHRALDKLDVSVLASDLASHFRSGHYHKILNILQVVEEFRHDTNPGYLVYLDYVSMVLARVLGEKRREQEAASYILANSADPSDVYMLKAEDVISIRKTAAETAASVLTLFPPNISQTQKYSRNEKVTVRYKDGRVETIKYKKVQHLIASGQCEII